MSPFSSKVGHNLTGDAQNNRGKNMRLCPTFIWGADSHGGTISLYTGTKWQQITAACQISPQKKGLVKSVQ